MNHLALLATYQTAYQKTVRELKALSVPSPYQHVHLEWLNTMNGFYNASGEMQYLPTDPVRTTIGLLLYAASVRRAQDAIIETRDEIKKAAMVFSQNEPGTFFGQ